MSTEAKDDRLNLRISQALKREVQAYCLHHGIDMSELVTRFFQRIVRNERSRLERFLEKAHERSK
jgi:antitoxin component of RelBE/YafQ-DinJ toxin-antitoxin module